MAINDRIKEARLNNKMTQEQLAKKIGVAKSTVTGYEKGNSEPNIETLGKIMDALGVDANYLWQDEGDFPMQVSFKEMQHIEKYRNLDVHGKEIVEVVIEKEHNRCIEENITPILRIPYYRQLASAGNGEYLFNDLPTDTIKIKKTPEAEKADFVLKVRGDSMEPTIKDGELLLIKKTPEINIGEIGIFIDQYDCYVKELGKDGLISHNKKYPIMIGSMYVKCVGRVLGTAMKA